MGPLDGRQALPGGGQAQGEAFELFEVQRGEGLAPLSCEFGEPQADDTVIVGVPGARDEACAVGPVDHPRTIF